MGQAVVDDLVGELGRLVGAAARERLDALVEVVVARDACAADRLVGGVDDALDAVFVIERLERDHRLNGRAVGVGDDAVVPIYVLGIDLGDDEGDVVVHTPLAGIVDDDRAVLGKDGRELCGSGAAGGEEGDVDLLVLDVVFGQFDDGIFLAHELDLFACALCGGVEVVVLDGKLLFFEDFEEFVADHTGRADYGDVIFFHKLSLGTRPWFCQKKSVFATGENGKVTFVPQIALHRDR